MKRLFTLLSMFLCLHMAWAESEENIRYNLNEADKTATVASGKDSFMHNSILFKGDIVIPETITVGGVTYTVTGLEDYCFATSSELTSITIPNTVTSIGERCFMSCSALTSVTLSNSITSLGNGCFWACSALTSITLPETLTTLGDKCFDGCEGLISITVPKSLVNLGDDCFNYVGVESIQVAKDNPVYDSRENCNAIIETKTNRLIQGCANTVIHKSVTEIGKYAFSGCGLTSINIPESVKKISEGAFAGCTVLTSVTIPDSVTVIGEGAFCGCWKLTNVNIPNSVREIREWAFSGCKAMTSITIPNSVTWIGDWAFSGCENLKEIILYQTDPSKIKVSERSGLYKTQATLYVPKEGVAAFQKDPFWSEFAAIYPLPMI